MNSGLMENVALVSSVGRFFFSSFIYIYIKKKNLLKGNTETDSVPSAFKFSWAGRIRNAFPS